jgi:hypothetical protein
MTQGTPAQFLHLSCDAPGVTSVENRITIELKRSPRRAEEARQLVRGGAAGSPEPYSQAIA